MRSFTLRTPRPLSGQLVLALSLALAAGCASEPSAEGPDAPAKPEKAAPEKAAEAPQGPPGDGKPQGPPDGPGGTDPRLGDYARERTLEEQERKALADNYFKTGQNLFRELRYREAGANLNRAVALDPEHIEARELRDRCMWILGDRKAEYSDAVRTLAEERMAKIQQARVEIERLFSEGQMLMEKQRFDAAEERFERVLEAIRWFPCDIDREGLKAKAEGRIAEAKRLAQEQERRRLQLLQEAARQAADHEQANTRRFREQTLKTLMTDAKEAQRLGKFDKTERLCKDILAQKPNDPDATRMLKEAIAERHRRDAVRTYRDKVESWRRQLEWIEASTIPYQQIFNFPTPGEWAEIEARDLPVTELLARQQESEDVLEINRRLDSQSITLNFDQTPFNEAIDFLRDITGLNYVITSDAGDLIENESVTVSLRLRNISLRNALNLIVSGGNENLKWRIENGVIKIGTAEERAEELVLEFYDVNEIVSTPPDYPAPELGLNLAGGGGGGGTSGGVLSFDDTEEAGGTGVDADKLIELIESKLGEDEGEGSVEFSGGILIVRKPLSAHKKIIKLLEALRRTVGIMVTVESRFIQVQDNLLEQIGLDIVNQDSTQLPNPPADGFGQILRPRGSAVGPQDIQVGYNYTDAQGQSNYRGGIVNTLSSLAPAGLPFQIGNEGGIALQYNFLDTFQLQAILEAVRKTQKARLVNAPRLTVFNGQRSHILNIRQRAYIQDVEVNQTGVIPVLNPVIGILNSGSILEVRPTVSHDRRYVSLEVKPTLATELQPRIPAPVTLAMSFTSIPIELPVITIQKLRATVTCPDGGTVLLGGLKNYDEFEGVSGVPFLMRLPLINNLFRRQAFHKLQASLIVLLKSNITIIRDEEKRTFGRE